MNKEDLIGLEYPFKVRIIKGNFWYDEKVGEIFTIFNINDDRTCWLLPAMSNKIELGSDGKLKKRNERSLINSVDCELVLDSDLTESNKDEIIFDLTSAYINLTEDELKQCEFEKYDTDKVIRVMSQYGRVWFQLRQMSTWGIQDSIYKYGYGVELYGLDLKTICNLYMPFDEPNYDTDLITKLRDGNLVTRDNSKILYPDNPINKRILENKIDILPQQEKISQNITEEIDLFA